MKKYYDMPLAMDDLVKMSGSTAESIESSFDVEFGVGPLTWLTVFRVFLSAEIMRFLPKYSDDKISRLVGFVELKTFQECFNSVFGSSTESYRKTMSIIEKSEDFSSVSKLLSTTRGEKSSIFLKLEASALKKTSNVLAAS